MTPPHLRVPLTFGAGAHAIQVRRDVFLVRWNKIVRPAVRPILRALPGAARLSISIRCPRLDPDSPRSCPHPA